MKIHSIIDEQRTYFNSKKTQSYKFRIEQLRKLKKVLQNHESLFNSALEKDLGKSPGQSFLFEISAVYSEIDYFIKNLKKWMKPKFAGSSLGTFPALSYKHKCSHGLTLVLSPWNYPYLLTLKPLIGAIAGGNCVAIKPSELTPNVSSALETVINDNFDKQFIYTFIGGVDMAQSLLKINFDFIFFTGSTQVGKIVAKSAAENLTPFVLELGGKSPCIVDSSVNIETVAKRIAWGKFSNAGQTCVAPDYILVHQSKKDELIESLNKHINHFYGPNIQASEDYGRIVGFRHFDRLVDLAKSSEVKLTSDRNDRFIAPLVSDKIKMDSALMKEEIFGPILPIFTFNEFSEVRQTLQNFDPSLACYLFSNNKKNKREFLEDYKFGGGCINDTLVHLSNKNLPFGGIKTSGNGNYHGRSSFEAFTYNKSIVKNTLWIDFPLRYAPLKKKIGLIKKVL